MASSAQVGITINGRKVSIPTLQHDKILTMHESPVRRAAPQHLEVVVKGSSGPIMLAKSRSFGWIAAMRLTAVRSP
jgi:hypothetical protein